MKDLIEKIKQKDRRALAKAITLVESHRAEDQLQSQQLIKALMPLCGNALRIGVSGVPGVGKSTFIEALGNYLIDDENLSVAVLAVDPSSPVSGGSLMGDKTRMEELSRKEQAFIRPSPTSGALGGVAYKTREASIICEAAGYDVIFVETVGVGQSEMQVSSMVDLFLLLMLPNAGDELQGIKRGIMEVGDLVLVNKADGSYMDAAERTAGELRSALHMLKGDEAARVLTVSSLQKEGIEKTWRLLVEKFEDLKKSGDLLVKRKSQDLHWFHALVRDGIEEKFRAQVSDLESEVSSAALSPLEGAKKIIDSIEVVQK